MKDVNIVVSFTMNLLSWESTLRDSRFCGKIEKL